MKKRIKQGYWVLGIIVILGFSISAYLWLLPLQEVSSVKEGDILFLKENTNSFSSSYWLEYYKENNGNYRNANPFNTDGKIIIKEGDEVTFYGLLGFIHRNITQNTLIIGKPGQDSLAEIYDFGNVDLKLNKKGTFYFYIPLKQENLLFYSEISESYVPYIDGAIVVI